jgi:hypothetical protein
MAAYSGRLAADAVMNFLASHTSRVASHQKLNRA